MKKIFLLVCVLTGIIPSCNNNLDVEITTPSVIPSDITYNNAEGSYVGNLMGYGSAYVTLDFFNSTNPNEGIRITGFCSLPTNFANFKLNEGTYNLATTGSARTYLPGTMNENNAIGTFLYDLSNNRRTLVTGGSFTVVLSDNVYTITTDFSGVDAATGNTVNDIMINYSGTIRFEDHSIIENSTYTAKGTPKWKISPGPSEWTGIMEFVQGASTDRYRITNWGNLGISVLCDIEDNGTIQINNYSTVYTDDLYNYYFEIAYINEENTRTLIIIEPEKYGYFVRYNPSTRVLDFSGTLTTDDGKTYEVVVGIAGWNKTTMDPEITLSDFYANVKLQLTPRTTSGNVALQQSNNVQDLVKNMNDLSTNHIPVKYTNIVSQKKIQK